MFTKTSWLETQVFSVYVTVLEDNEQSIDMNTTYLFMIIFGAE